MLTPTPRSSTVFPLPLVHYLREKEVDIAPLLAEVGLEEGALTDPNLRLPYDTIDALITGAVEATQDRALPIRAAEHVHAGDWGVFEHLLRTSATSEEVLDKVFRFSRLLADGKLEMRRDYEKGELWVEVEEIPQNSAAVAEFSLASWVAFGRLIAGPSLVPLLVRFRHPAPADTSEHQRFFACPLEFDADRYGVVFEIGTDDERPVLVDRALAEFVLERAQQLLELQDGGSTVEAVEVRVLAAFRSGNPSVEQIARQMRMSPRTLRRRLDSEGATFQALRDRLREDRARHLLKDPNLTIGEVAYLLGFAEPSAFHRAFKRWTGATPAEYRNAGAAS